MVRRWAAVGVVDGDMMDVKSRNKGIMSVENITCNILKICLCFHLLSGFQGVKRGGGFDSHSITLAVHPPGRCGWQQSPALCSTLRPQRAGAFSCSGGVAALQWWVIPY